MRTFFDISPKLIAIAALGLLTACAEPRSLKAPYNIAGDYIASGYMGDGNFASDISMSSAKCKVSRPGNTSGICTKVTFAAKTSNWAGVYWQSPANNWGDFPGSRIQGATKLTFWSLGDRGGEVVEFKAGGINSPQKKFNDSFERGLPSRVVALDTTWHQYTIDLRDANLNSVIGAFAWIAKRSDNPDGLTFYLDEIQYEK
jgi:hypothetical protein